MHSAVHACPLLYVNVEGSVFGSVGEESFGMPISPLVAPHDMPEPKLDACLEPCYLRLFGPLTLEVGDQKQSRFPTKRSALLLAALAISREQRVGRDELAEMLWPDDYLDLTRMRLRQELRRLRMAVEGFGCFLRADRQWVELETGSLLTDVQDFDRSLAGAAVALDPSSKLAHLQRVVALSCGTFLSGHHEPWVQATRRNYSEKARRACLALAETLDLLGNHEGALEATIGAVRRDPLDIEANTVLIRRLVKRGQAAKARQAFFEFDAMMVRELGYHPPASIKAILDSGCSETALVPQVAPVALVAPSKLNRPTQLIGRDDLLSSIETELARSGVNLVLAGMPGVGKTHLIKESAWRFSRRFNLPVQFGGDPLPVEDGLFVIEKHLGLEQLIELSRVATQCGWRVLSESRTRVQSDEILEIFVPCLPVPSHQASSAEIDRNPAVRMLASGNSELMLPKFGASETPHLAELARRLDGLPLALKSFSDRLKVESPDRVLRDFETKATQFVQNRNGNEESFCSAISAKLACLPTSARQNLMALSLLDGASSDLARQISAGDNSEDDWHLLERAFLIAISGQATNRRLHVPLLVSIALQNEFTLAQWSQASCIVWQAVAEWTYKESRLQTGPHQDQSFANIVAEFTNIRKGLTWCIANQPHTAAHFVAGTWRSLCARGNPSQDGILLLEAAKAGAHLLPLDIAGEAWIGAAITLSTMGQLESAEMAYHQAIAVFESYDNLACVGWAELNYSVHVLSQIDKPRALATLKRLADNACNSNLKTLALSDYALILASTGVIGESVRIAEEVFALRLQSQDLTAHARAYADLGELYQVAGRTKAARPLILEGIRRLREAGIQNMLLDQLIFLAEISLDDHPIDASNVEEVLVEAKNIADRVGTVRMAIQIASVRTVLASRNSDPRTLIITIEELFRLTRLCDEPQIRENSLRLLARELQFHGNEEYSNAISLALGDHICGGYNVGWNALMSTDSHATICVLAVVLAREALA